MCYTTIRLGKMLILLSILVLGCAKNSIAADYDAISYNVVDRSKVVRSTSIQRGLKELVVRLMGIREVTEYSAVRELLRRPEQFVQQYQYYSNQGKVNTDEFIRIEISFDTDAVRRILRTANIPLWLGQRPKVLVWMAVDEGEERYLLANNTGQDIRLLMERAAQARGISLLFPLLDLQDQGQIQYMDVWGGFFDYIKAASERYSASVILAGRVYRDPLDNDWIGGPWDMQLDTEHFLMEGGKGALESVLEQIIDALVDRMREQSDPLDDLLVDTVLTIKVQGVRGISDYARVINYLEDLSVVKEVRVNALLGDQLELILMLEGGVQYLEKEIALGSLLNMLPVADEHWYQLQP